MNAHAFRRSPRATAAHAAQANRLAAGALYLLTFLTSVPTLALYRPVLDQPDFVLGTGSTTSVLGGHIARGAPGRVLCRYGRGPLPGRPEAQRDGRSRVRRLPADRGRPDPSRRRQPARDRHPATGLRSVRHRLAAHGLANAGRDLPPGLPAQPEPHARNQRPVPGIGDVPVRPRAASHPTAGLARRSPLLASDAAILWGSYGPESPLAVLAALPVALWELALGAWLMARGFRPAPQLGQEPARPAGTPDADPVTSAGSPRGQRWA